MNRCNILSFILFLMSFLPNAGAQVSVGSTFRVMPGVSLGYTFGIGVNAGINCGLSFIDYTAGKLPAYGGIDVSYAVFTQKMEVYKSGYYNVRAINLMNVINEQIYTKIGISKTRLKWGANNMNTNRSKSWGANVEAGFSPKPGYPFIGLHWFTPNNGCLGLNNDNPIFLSLGYQYPVTFYHQSNAAPELKPGKSVLGF
jgi:hypothetical protein